MESFLAKEFESLKNGDKKALIYLIKSARWLEKAYLKQGEGCLSVKDIHEGLIYRPARIKVKAYDAINKKDVTIKASNYLAIVFQHELDHFNGTLYYDHINKDNPMYIDESAIAIE